MNLHFGFSYIGLIFLLMLTIPNIIWTKNKPKKYEEYEKNENKFLLAFERIGQVLVTTLMLIFSDEKECFRFPQVLFLIAALIAMLMYELWWVKYFAGERRMQDFYSSLLGIPVAGATLPVVASALIGICKCNLPLIIATIILGIGHIGLHLIHSKRQ